MFLKVFLLRSNVIHQPMIHVLTNLSVGSHLTIRLLAFLSLRPGSRFLGKETKLLTSSTTSLLVAHKLTHSRLCLSTLKSTSPCSSPIKNSLPLASPVRPPCTKNLRVHFCYQQLEFSFFLTFLFFSRGSLLQIRRYQTSKKILDERS